MSLNGLMGMVVIGGLLIALTYWAMCRVVVPKVQLREAKKKKKGPKMGARRAGSLRAGCSHTLAAGLAREGALAAADRPALVPAGVGESFAFLAKSSYIRDMAVLVVCYGVAINLVEVRGPGRLPGRCCGRPRPRSTALSSALLRSPAVLHIPRAPPRPSPALLPLPCPQVTWKSKIKAQYPNPNDYSAFMGEFSTATGAVTFCMMILSGFIFKKFGWGVAAMITPTVLLLTGASAAGHMRLLRGAPALPRPFDVPPLALLTSRPPRPPLPLQVSSSSPWCCAALS